MNNFPAGFQTPNERKVETQTFFQPQSNRFTLETVIADGTCCLNWRVLETGADGRQRRLLLKRGKGSWKDPELRNEIEKLLRLKNAAHVVRLIVHRDDETAPSEAERQVQLDLEPSGFLAGLTGPIAVTEYLENGTIRQLIKRCRKRNIPVPNRVLWYFLLCLVRAVIEMKYPTKIPFDQPSYNITTEEVLPSELENTHPTGIQSINHDDLHLENIMMGDPGYREEIVVPIIKLIDFGNAKDVEPGVEPNNMAPLIETMIMIIAQSEVPDDDYVQFEGYTTSASEILDVEGGNGARYPGLDDVLRRTLAQCLAEDLSQRPGLRALHDTAVAYAFPSDDPEIDREDFDRARASSIEQRRVVLRWVKEFIFDADTT
ncbi:hypothetical protein F4778DRAFT_762103 [Xylariomycetidae sp. FL2044]|nr:hypothetical protein F4778DRAFT_762103 [Xylariomycetidae sp. FL2044]